MRPLPRHRVALAAVGRVDPAVVVPWRRERQRPVPKGRVDDGQGAQHAQHHHGHQGWWVGDCYSQLYGEMQQGEHSPVSTENSLRNAVLAD